jgi:hypothetical protein
MERLQRWTPAIIWCVVLISFVMSAHVFFRLVDFAPYYAVDDSLANISTNISNAGAYGMPAAPLEFGGGHSLRLGSMLNYGPLTFYLGALLDWTFGTSYVILRSIHLLSIFAVIGMAVVVFRRISGGLAAALAAVLLNIFWAAEWPMFRPDAVTAALMMAAVAASSWALWRGSLSSWFLVGLMAASAAGNHQVAWSIVPATMIIWLASLALAIPENGKLVRVHLRTLISFGAGGLMGTIIYLTGTGFRIGDLISLWRDYARLTSELMKPANLTFRHIIAKQFDLAWGALPFPEFAVLQALAALAGILAIAGLVRSLTVQRMPSTWVRVVALTLPPFAAGASYLLSLGIYTNFHSGYVIPVHFLTAWSACSAIAALLVLLTPHLSLRSNAMMHVATAAVGAAFLLTASAAPLKGTRWDYIKSAQVPFSEYSNNVLDEIPLDARVLGDVVFGLKSGSALNLIYLSEGLFLLNNVKPEEKDRLAPQYLVLNRYLDDLAFGALGGENPNPYKRNAFGLLSSMREWNSTFKISKIVNGAPYGSTYVYRAFDAPSDASAPQDESTLPVVAAYLPAERRWLRHLGPPLSVPVGPSEPLHLKLTIGSNSHSITAATTNVAILPPGIYLATVRVHPKTAAEAGERPCFITSTTSLALSTTFGDLGFGVQLIPCFAGESSIHLVVRHSGGRVFFSGIGDVSGFEVESIRPLISGSDDGSPLPPTQKWGVVAKNGDMTIHGSETLIAGDNSKFGYQIVSPPIPVPANAVADIRVVVEPINGAFGVGVLSEDQSRWLAPPIVRTTAGVEFDTGKARAIHVVVANANSAVLPQPAKFHFAGGSIRFRPREGDAYVRALAACFKGYSRSMPDYCKKGESGDAPPLLH